MIDWDRVEEYKAEALRRSQIDRNEKITVSARELYDWLAALEGTPVARFANRQEGDK